ncbi:hypothetical protein AGLY_004697 [Aphis glycines]|uniref:Protein tincar n=1 Tax=Aphis glycines TaxID=307491 RepID=A0A6G0TUL0_APHGL|nr:hypothetical protein AGLY_004697 [Aphis glycines]
MAENGNYAGGKGHFCQLNSLWSVWYGLLATALNVYSVLLATRRLSEYLEVVWPPKSVLPPRYEVHCFVATIGMAAVLVPLVAFTAAFRTGNMANDSDKLGNLLDVRRRRLSSCWTHGPPSSSTLHSFTALALLVVKLMIEARLIQAGLMSTNAGDTDGVMSIEFFNYAMALFIYCGRYASVFWETNKCFATLFSVQLFANAIQCLSLYLFTCILYKMQVLGVCKMVKELPAGPTTYHLVLDHLDTAVLFTVTTVLIFVSNSIVYYYGYTRFSGFVKRQTGGRKTVADAYSSLMPYCASVLALLAVVASESPLLYNAIVVFRSSLNGVVLACLLNSTAHVFVWIAMWSVLTLKPCWMFNLHLFLEYDPKGGSGGASGGGGAGGGEGDDAQRVPLLVVAQGATYSLTEKTAKRIVTSVVERVVADYTRVAANSDKQKYKRTPKTMSDEQIYWPRPKSSSGRSCLSEMEDSDEQSGCFGCKRTKKSTRGIPMDKINRRGVSPEDDGDYAKLRELPMVARATNDHSDDNTSEDTKLLDTVREGVITYASANTRELFYSPATPPPPPPPIQEDISSAAEFHASKTQVSKQQQQLREHAYRGGGGGGVYSKNDGGDGPAAAGRPQRTSGAASVTTADDFEEEDTVKSESEASAAGHSPQAACSGHSESSSDSHDTAATMPLPPPPPPLQLSPAASTSTLSPTDDEQRRRASYADLQIIDTVVIRHKGGPGAKARMPPDPCTRPTNVSLSSFTEPRGARNRPGSVPGWRTMPHNVAAPAPPPQVKAPSHYRQYQHQHQQQQQQQQQINYQQHQRQWSSSYNGGGVGVSGVKASGVRSRNHSTIPTHHNGVRLFQQHQQQSYGQ